VSVVGLGVLAVIVLAIGPKVRGFKPVRRQWTFKSDKNPYHDFFGGEVKPSAPYPRILRHVKNLAEYERDTSSTKFTVFLAKFLLLRY
jgi:hypothetical protein